MQNMYEVLFDLTDVAFLRFVGKEYAWKFDRLYKNGMLFLLFSGMA